MSGRFGILSGLCTLSLPGYTKQDKKVDEVEASRAGNMASPIQKHCTLPEDLPGPHRWATSPAPEVPAAARTELDRGDVRCDAESPLVTGALQGSAGARGNPAHLGKAGGEHVEGKAPYQPFSWGHAFGSILGTPTCLLSPSMRSCAWEWPEGLTAQAQHADRPSFRAPSARALPGETRAPLSQPAVYACCFASEHFLLSRVTLRAVFLIYIPSICIIIIRYHTQAAEVLGSLSCVQAAEDRSENKKDWASWEVQSDDNEKVLTCDQHNTREG